MSSVTARVSLGGVVFGMAQTAANPPAAAARVPVRDVFLVLLARLPQVAVQVDEPRHHPAAAHVDDAHVPPQAARDAGADPGDEAVLHQHVRLGVDSSPHPPRVLMTRPPRRQKSIRRALLIGGCPPRVNG